ncbi:LuxR C-terminal-related transcriptional regulator [Pseudomonas sp. LS44]|uniref:helix-turn-helix transcriptional regulator n=1 Tax=Pseudomonas sp. LS44 TaxID=1357074 RepID=UPI00215A41CF|nr:LuxR C-terminal-related transcriptional regulator [Pseudomonas sp. LS44]UVE16127.1 LuxR C-terminal-related transcriptional regulator [Pseudomonas sp. LS44]
MTRCLVTTIQSAQGVDEEPPRQPFAYLPRERLTSELLTRPRRLRLLCAPAGYGKTALLNACLSRRAGGARHVWLDMAGRPLTLEQFCMQLSTRLGAEAAQCRAPQALLEYLGRASDLWLILDDFPTERCAGLDDWLDQLLHSAAPVQLWVSCRRRPAWRLGRLLADGELIELDAALLAFSREEFEAVVELFEPDISPSSRISLWSSTRGWCAGVRLLLSVPGCHDRTGTAWVRAYLGDEVLASLSPDECRLLSRMAYLPRISASLCDQLWPDLGAGDLFQGLLQTQSFFLPLEGPDDSWYGMLPVVSTALRQELGAAELNRLRLDACRLLYADGFIDEAIELALSAGQMEMAACYMERLKLDWMYVARNLRTWLEWRSHLSLQLLESTPSLIYMNARALLSTWRLDEAHACITRLSSLYPQPRVQVNVRMMANWQALQGTLQGLRGDAAGAREHCAAALQHLEMRDWQSSFLCYSTLSRVAMAEGEPEQAHRWQQASLTLARRQGCLASEVLINADRIRQLILADELELAGLMLGECFDLISADNTHHSLLLGRLQMLEGELYLLRGDLDACEKALKAGLENALASADPYALHAWVGLAEVAACRNDFDQARFQLCRAERHMQCGRVEEGCYQLLLDYQQLRLLARQGAWERMLPLALAAEAALLGTSRRLPPLHSPSLPQRFQLLLALAEWGTGQGQAAMERLRRLLADCEQLCFRGLSAEARVALARVEQELGSEPDAPAGQSSRPLVNTSLLYGRHSQRGVSPLANRQQGGDGLTSREFSVLELVAQGLSNQEISDRLFISLSTVKAHAVSINHKLGVKRRTQAVMRAKSMGMLA